MDNSIRVQRDMISLEAMNPASALKALTKRLPGYVASIRGFIQTTLSNDAPKVGLVNTSGLEKSLKSKNYMDVRDHEVYVPPGLNVSYLNYITALDKCQDIVDGLMSDTLEPFSKWLAIQLTNPDQLRSVRANASNVGIKFHDLDDAKKAVGKCFNPRSTETSSTFGKAFDRLSDVNKTQKELNNLNIRFSKVSRSDLIAKVDEINEFLAKLIEKIESKEEGYQMSGQVLDTLAKITYALGEEVEFYSVYGYQLQALTQAVEDSVEALEDVLK